jgi:hypothetical protein
MRTVALIVGLIGAVLALIISILYSVFHVLGQIMGVTQDSGHLFLGLFSALLGGLGAFLAPIFPLLAAVLLIAAGVGVFVAVGWWGLFAAPFLFVAAALTFSHRRINLPGAA